MIFDVGIYLSLSTKAEDSLRCYYAKISAMNTTTGTKLTFKTKFLVIPELFATIKDKLNHDSNLGCACIALGKHSFDNDDRKKLIKNGQIIGFKKVKIIDSCSAKFLNAISSCLKNPQSHNVIWLLHNYSGYIWIRSKATNAFELFTVLKNNWFKGGWKAMNMIPDVIICTQSISHLWKVMKLAFPKCRIFSILDDAYENVSNGALIKTQIMANNPMMLKYNCEPVLTYSIVKGRQKVVEKNISLPFMKIVETGLEDIELQVLHDHQVLETFLLHRKGTYIIHIDENGIFETKKLGDAWRRRNGVSSQGILSIEPPKPSLPQQKVIKV